MNKVTVFLVFLCTLLIALVVGNMLDVQNVKAQSATGLSIFGGGTFATCASPPTGITAGVCVGSDKAGYWNGTTYIPFSSTGAVSITINGTTKTLPASFTISGTTTSPAIATAPTVTVTPATVIAAQ